MNASNQIDVHHVSSNNNEVSSKIFDIKLPEMLANYTANNSSSSSTTNVMHNSTAIGNATNGWSSSTHVQVLHNHNHIGNCNSVNNNNSGYSANSNNNSSSSSNNNIDAHMSITNPNTLMYRNVMNIEGTNWSSSDINSGNDNCYSKSKDCEAVPHIPFDSVAFDTFVNIDIDIDHATDYLLMQSEGNSSFNSIRNLEAVSATYTDNCEDYALLDNRISDMVRIIFEFSPCLFLFDLISIELQLKL